MISAKMPNIFMSKPATWFPLSNMSMLTWALIINSALANMAGIEEMTVIKNQSLVFWEEYKSISIPIIDTSGSDK